MVFVFSHAGVVIVRRHFRGGVVWGAGENFDTAAKKSRTDGTPTQTINNTRSSTIVFFSLVLLLVLFFRGKSDKINNLENEVKIRRATKTRKKKKIQNDDAKEDPVRILRVVTGYEKIK